MVFDNTPSDKIQFRALGEAPSPGTCFVCGAANREDGYIDFGVWLEYIGEALICTTCLTQAAEITHMLTSDEAQHLKEISERVATQNTALTEELEAANERLRHYDALLNGAGGFVSSATGGGDSSEPTLFDPSVKEPGVGKRTLEESPVGERELISIATVGENDGAGSGSGLSL